MKKMHIVQPLIYMLDILASYQTFDTGEMYFQNWITLGLWLNYSRVIIYPGSEYGCIPLLRSTLQLGDAPWLTVPAQVHSYIFFSYINSYT